MEAQNKHLITNGAKAKQKLKPLVARGVLLNSNNQESYSVTCADWSKDGKLLAIGNQHRNDDKINFKMLLNADH